MRIGALTTDGTPRRLLLVGPAGSGKSTALRAALAEIAVAHLAQPALAPAPLWIQARELAQARNHLTLIAALASAVAYLTGEEMSDQALVDHLREGCLALVIDGLDEAPPGSGLAAELSDLFAVHPKLSGLLSARPSALAINMPGFVVYEMPRLDKAALRDLISRTDEEAKHLLPVFLSTLEAHPILSELADSPLLATLMWEIFRARGSLPVNLAELVADYVDTAVQLETRKMLGEPVPTHQVLELLGDAAREIFVSGEADLSFQRMQALAVGIAGEAAAPRLLSSVLERLPLLNASAEARFTFAHRIVLDYFAMWRLRDDPQGILDVASRGDPYLVLLAAGLVPDPAPLIGSLLERGEIVMAARCVTGARAVSNALRDVVADRLRGMLGPSVLSLLGLRIPKRLPERTQPAADDELLVALTAALAEDQTAGERGRSLEAFGRLLFSRVFEIIEERYWTRAGEIDLIAEIKLAEPFWAEFGGDVFIECKNWNSRLAMEKVSAFLVKLEQRRVRLGFILSTRGFTKAAEEVIRLQAPNPARPLIVPLAIDDVHDALQRGEAIDYFLKRRIRTTKYGRSL
jgi:Holliday junction resolvase-like predicted endonuclease